MMLPLLEAFVPCPGCANHAPRPLHVFRNLKPIVPIPFLALLGCPHCGLVYTSPRPDGELSSYYDAGVEGGWEKGRDFDDASRAEKFEKQMAVKHEVAGRLLDAIAPLVALPEGSGREAFDFGCGAGAFLDVLQDRGWHTTGLEPAHLREFVRRRHVVIDGIPDSPHFHLVNVSHVLEHLLHPGDTLQALARASHRGAVLLCSVPDLEALPRHGDMHYVTNSVHINSFTSVSLAGLLRRAGWQPVRVASGGFLPKVSEKEATRLMALAVRDDEAASVSFPVEPLAVAEDALRAYGRMLGADGKVRSSKFEVEK